MNSRESRGTDLALYFFSFLSGVAALSYEVVWTKLLSLAFGSTTLAASATLAGFMGGMGVGAWAYHRVLARWHSPITLYGILELGIALAALCVTLGLPSLPGLFADTAEALPAGVGLDLGRVLCAFVVLSLPAVLMGATFPALCAAMIRGPSGVDRHLGWLYGLNTLGAATGALLAGFLWIELSGLKATVWFGNSLNILVGVASLLLSRHMRKLDNPSASVEPKPDGTRNPLGFALVAGALFISGFATFAYEIVWFRTLRYLFANNTYAFTIMLVVFLTGLGIGSLTFRRISRRVPAEFALAGCHMAIAVLSLGGMALASIAIATPSIEGQISAFSPLVGNLAWWQRLLLFSASGFAILLPATWLMGLAFPLASALLLGDAKTADQVGRNAGLAVFLSNAGSILGAFASAVWLIPSLGTVASLQIIACVSLALGVALVTPARGRDALRFTCSAIAVLMSGFFMLILPERIGFVGAGNQRSMDTAQLIYENEGDLATVQVWRFGLGRSAMGMAIDGTIIGSNTPIFKRMDKKQKLLAHLPMALDSNIQRTLNIGLGSASTLKSLSAYSGVTALDAIEINGAVVEAALLFPESSVLSDVRAKVHVDDAIHFLLRSQGRYDLIVSDGKLARGFSGNAKLLSTEFYALSSQRLTPSGLFVQWIPLDSAGDFRTVLRTFMESFEYAAAYFDPPTLLLLVGSNQPIQGRKNLTNDDSLQLRTKDEIAALGISGASALRARRVAGKRALLSVAEGAQVNSWNHPVLEFSSFRTPDRPGEILSDNCSLLLEARTFEAQQLQTIPPSRELQAMAEYHEAACAFFRNDDTAARRLSGAAVRIDPLNGGAMELYKKLTPPMPEPSNR
ncbi:hypothetical protein MK489_16990 [Myxococcota bacterium]|nr:hypothetical protein [Myxococcota bacterium]